MARNAYLIITDLHLGKVAAPNRIDYRKESMHVQRHLLKIAHKYKQAGYSIKTLFLGDIFHSSYSDVFDAITDHDFLSLWSRRAGECYTVLGNHELSYYQANPFYTLVNIIDSERIQRVMNKVWTPLGAENVIHVIDTLKDGDVSFYFNHYGTGVQKAEGKITIGLFHQELIDKQMIQDMTCEYGYKQFAKPVDVESSGVLSGYNYCFFGHFHKTYGKWKKGDTILHYLASLGRPNESEVIDNFLERCIPVILVDDGSFQGIEDNFFQLMNRKACIVEDIVFKQRDEYEKNKMVKELRQYVPLGDDPILNLKSVFAEEPAICMMLEDLQVYAVDRRGEEIKRKLRDIRLENE